MDEAAFDAAIAAGGMVELGDAMPDTYREQVTRIMGFQCLAEIVGGLMFAEWIPRTPSLLRKMMLTAKIQDEMGHAYYLLRTCEELGLSRDRIIEDYLSGTSKVLNVFHYKIDTWHEWPICALLQNSAALVQFKSLVKTSFAPYQRALKRILKEESFHYHNALDLARVLSEQPDQRALVQAGLDKWWLPVLAYFGPPDKESEHNARNLRWRLKVDSNDALRQAWLRQMVPVIRELGLVIPDSALAFDEASGRWSYTEPDWVETRAIIKGSRPETEKWRALLERNYRASAWTRPGDFGVAV
ncbi:MAG: 1,2-phenylacetyl-CoA epoxidase subunit A [Candidatus Velthaea sp.]